MDTTTAAHKAQARHTRLISALNRKPLSKWTTKDFAALKATREARDLAVAALAARPIQKESVAKDDLAAVEYVLGLRDEGKAA